MCGLVCLSMYSLVHPVRYRLDGLGAVLITQPSIVLIIRLSTTLPASAYTGSLCTAKVETGSQRLLALLPGLGNFLGSSS